MLEVLKNLFENNVISEEFKAEIEVAWNKKIQENRDLVTAELREEFAQKFEVEKTRLTEAIESMMTEKLSAEIVEFVEDKKQLAEAKAKYHKKMKKDSEAMKEFVFRKLHNELSELYEDQKKMSDNFGKLEQFVIAQLAKELNEFHQDKKAVVETKVRLVKEAKSHLDAVKAKFIQRSAKMVEETVVKTLNKEITQLKEDISSARANDFGRRIFEAFASEYTHSYLSEKSEVQKVLKDLEATQAKLAEAKSQIAEKQTLAESKERELSRVREMSVRKETLGELLGPLAKDKREVMASLLESVQTAKLRSAFDKYLPAVMSDGAVTKQALIEAKAVTGNKQTKSTYGAESNIVDIRRLAGIK